MKSRTHKSSAVRFAGIRVFLFALAAVGFFGAGGMGHAGCASLDVGADMTIPCVEFGGETFSLTIDFHQEASDRTGLYWKFDPAAVGAGEGLPCGALDDELGLTIPCLEFDGEQLYLALDFHDDPSFPEGAFWKLASARAAPVKMTLDEVKYWAYNISEVDTARQRRQLSGSHFDMYVLEPVVTEKDNENFDIASLIRDIRRNNIDVRGVDPLILAYIDIGQAETWRWYYKDDWKVGDPDWIVSEDPDGWEGCHPVAYWREEWKRIVITGHEGRSMVEESLKAGFDGIYMDWVGAFSEESVVARAALDGKNPSEEMMDFIGEIRDYARALSPNKNPDYLVIAQNASDLYETDPSRYRQVIDAIAVEGLWYDGDGGFDQWSDPTGYNMDADNLYPGWPAEVLAMLQPMKQHMPVFCVEYAQDAGGDDFASRVYTTLAPAQGFIPYCTRRSLSRLSTTPYPLGYTPQDY